MRQINDIVNGQPQQSTMPLTTRGGAVVPNGAHTQGRAGHRLMRKPNRRTLDRVKTRQYENWLPQETIIEVPPTPPDRRETQIPRTRAKGEIVPCSHFGEFRKEVYPTYHFCENCTHYDIDSQCPTSKSRVKRNSKRYACRAKHKSFAHPTQKVRSKRKVHMVFE